MNPIIRLGLFLGAGIWLTACAIIDLRTGLVPNKLTLPVIAGGTLLTFYRSVYTHSPNLLLTMIGLWGVFTIPWLLGNIYGGGDQKLLMAISSLCPIIDTALWVSVGMLGSWFVWVVYRLYAGKLKITGRWRGTWTLATGGIIAIAQQLQLFSH